jgi:nucleoside-diphosphate-sugar epimerase
MRVLVTGANGFVGSAVVRALARHGYDVLALVRSHAKGRALTCHGAQLAIGDLWQPTTYVPLVCNVDAVIHVAHEQPTGRWTAGKIESMHQGDALMTHALACACHFQGKRLIYSSGALTHAKYQGQWIDETAPAWPCRLAAGHAARVQELARWQREYGLDAISVSPGFIYGPGGMLKLTVDLLGRRRYRMIGRGDNYWSLVHVDDVAEGYVRALQHGRPGENYFLSDDQPLTRRVVIDHLCQDLRLPRVGGVPGWLVGAILGSPLVEALTASFRLDASKARQELGWAPRYHTFAEGMHTVVAQLTRRQPVTTAGDVLVAGW